MKKKNSLDEFLRSDVADIRSQGAQLLHGLGESELELYFDGCDIDAQGRILGDVPWSDELLDVFLEFRSDRESIIGLDLRGTGRLGHLTCLRHVPNLRYLDVGGEDVSFVNTGHWPRSLCLLRCLPFGVDDAVDRDNPFALLADRPGLMIHWWGDYEVVAFVSSHQRVHDPYGGLQIFAFIDQHFEEGLLKSYLVNYFAGGGSEGPVFGRVFVTFEGDHAISVYSDESFDLNPAEADRYHSRLGFGQVYRFDGQEWGPGTSCIGYLSDNMQISCIDNPGDDLPDGFMHYDWDRGKTPRIHRGTTMTSWPALNRLPDNGLWWEFIECFDEPFGNGELYYCSPRARYHNGNSRDPQFFLGCASCTSAHGGDIPGLSVGFPMDQQWEMRRSVANVTTRWRLPRTMDDEFNYFFCDTSLLDTALLVIHGVSYEALSFDPTLLATPEAKSLAIAFEKDPKSWQRVISLKERSKIREAVEAYFENVGLIVDGFRFTERGQIEVMAKGVASLFEYDAYIRRISDSSKLKWDFIDFEHGLGVCYYTDDGGGNHAHSSDVKERTFERYKKFLVERVELEYPQRLK